MIISRTVSTIENPIPVWKGPLENGIDDMLVLIEAVPPLSGHPELTQIPISDALTVNKNAGIGDKIPDDNKTKFELITATVFDDQEPSL